MKCLVCHATVWNYRYTSHDRMFGVPGEFRVLRCTSCSLARIDPMPEKSTLSKYYPHTYYSYLENAKPSIIWRLREYLVLHRGSPFNYFIRVPAIPAYVKKGRVMDVGCGTGDTLLLLKRIGWTAYGLDIDAQAIRIAKHRGLQNVRTGTYRDIEKYPDNYFDAIRLYHVIEHLDDPARAIALFNRKLKKNGELLIGTPNIDSLIARVGGRYWYNLDTPRHLYIFSPKTLTALVKGSQFSGTRISFCSAGGIVGTIQYLIEQAVGKKVPLIGSTLLILIFYPVEWVFDQLHAGDVFVLTARKQVL